MSGGYFDYKQFDLDYITGDIDVILEKMEELKPEPDNEYDYSPETYQQIEKIKKDLKEVIEIIKNKKLEIVSKKISALDWMLSGDTGEEQFLKEMRNYK